MLKIKDVTIAYQDNILLNHISLALKGDEKKVITGPSGCGKSSLLHAIIGYKEFDGDIEVNNIKVMPSNFVKIRAQIAYISQDVIMGADVVKDALLLPFSFKANAKILPAQEKIDEALELVRLPKRLLSQNCHELSGGERQRISIARALLLQRKIFLADEISSALDAKVRDDIIEVFQSLNASVLLITHEERVIESFSKVYRVKDGRLV